MEVVKVKKPSIAILRKLRKGENGTVLKGDDFELIVNPLMAKKIRKAHSKNKGIRVKLESNEIKEMEGKGVWGWIKRAGRSAVSAVEKVAEPVAKIGGEATKLITGSAPLGKAGESVGRFLLGKDELAGAVGALGGIGGSEAGAGLAIAVGQPELAPIAGIVGGVVGSAVAKYGTKEVEKLTKPKKISKLTPKQAQKKIDQQIKKQQKEIEKKQKEAEKQRKKQEKEMRKQALKPYKKRDVSGRLKTFKTTTGADIDPVPVETLFQGTGMKLVPLRGKGLVAEGRGLVAENYGRGIVAEGSGEGISGEGIIAEGEGIQLSIKPKKEMMKTKPVKSKDYLKAEKSLTKIEEILKSMKGKGLPEEEDKPILGRDPDTYTPKPILGRDPATYTPRFVIHRPDVQRNHNLKFKPHKYDAISGSKLLGRLHQGHLSQPTRMNHMWKHTLGLPK